MEPTQQPNPTPEATPSIEPTPVVETAPTATTQATPSPAATPVAQPYEQSPQQINTPSTKKGMAITSMVLGIVSIVIAILWFIAAPVAIAAVILGIISLVKKHGGKGMSITGIVTGAVTVFIIVPLILVTVLAYQGITERANESAEKSQRLKTEQQLFN